MDGLLSYDIPLKSIEDAALGRLIEWYKTFTKDEDLVTQLRKITAMRDHVAHQGLVFSLQEQFDETFLNQKTAAQLLSSWSKTLPRFLDLANARQRR